MPKFDVVVGNPPYQGLKTNKGAGSGNAIWQKFVEIGYDSIINKGYLCFIHPVDLRLGPVSRKKKNAQNILLNNQIEYIKLHQKPFPGIDQLVDWYILKKENKKYESKIEYLNGIYKELITTKPITNIGGPTLNSILKKVFTVDNNGFNFGSSFWFDPDDGKNKLYKYAHGGNYLKGEYKYYDTPHKYQFHPKVLMSNVRMPRPVYDSGELGIAGHVSFILVKNKKEGDFFINLIKSDLMKFLYQIFASDHLRPDGYGARWQNNYPLSRIKLCEINLENENKVYKHFKLSDKEILFIKEHTREKNDKSSESSKDNPGTPGLDEQNRTKSGKAEQDPLSIK